MKKRITYFDLAKGIGIILVVLGHMENITTGLRVWISSFHMPLFFIISGMLIAAKDEIDVYSDKAITDKSVNGKNSHVLSLISKKAKGILIPYMWFSVFYIPIDVMNLYIHNVDMHTFIQNILDSLTLSGVSVMWFLPALFIAEAVAIVIIDKVGEKAGSYDKIAGYAIVFGISIAVSLVAYGIWYLIRPYFDAHSSEYVIATSLGFVRTILRGITLSIHVVTGFMMFKIIKLTEEKIGKYSLVFGVILFSLNLAFCFNNGAVDNHFLTLNSLGTYYICSLFGSMAVILICKGFGSIPFIEFYGKNSLIVMATHLQCYILYAGIRIALLIDVYVTRAKSYVYMFNSVFFTMLIEAAVIYVINRFFPFIVGKRKTVEK